ncbi:unnamed protein product, partial [Gongylonema pulchrum]|uniref:Elongator complex protein 6 n=1 Tax=Gongylonema pulchrum TaxID=637853 RepID=A0A183F0I7_9BILA
MRHVYDVRLHGKDLAKLMELFKFLGDKWTAFMGFARTTLKLHTLLVHCPRELLQYGTPADFTAFHFESFNRKLKVRQQCSRGVVGLFVLLHELLQRNIDASQRSAQSRAFLEHLGVCDSQYSSKYVVLRNGGRLLNMDGNENGIEAQGLQNKTTYQRYEYHGRTYASR